MDKKQLAEDIMKSLEEGKQYSKEELNDIVQKAVTSQAATAENKPASEEALNGENAPTIQDATTPSQEAAPQDNVTQEEIVTQEATQEVAKEEVIEVPECVNAEGDPQGGKVEPIFAPGLFNREFVTGATLKQGPSGNIMTNMKQPNADYVDQYKNSTKNQKMTHVDFEKDSKKN